MKLPIYLTKFATDAVFIGSLIHWTDMNVWLAGLFWAIGSILAYITKRAKLTTGMIKYVFASSVAAAWVGYWVIGLFY